MTKKYFTYLTNCVCARGIDIKKMTDSAKEITYRTFRSKISRKEFIDLETSFGYSVSNDGGLRICNDYTVSFWKSTYRGKPCYYMDHSSIEYVFVEAL